MLPDGTFVPASPENREKARQLWKPDKDGMDLNDIDRSDRQLDTDEILQQKTNNQLKQQLENKERELDNQREQMEQERDIYKEQQERDQLQRDTLERERHKLEMEVQLLQLQRQQERALQEMKEECERQLHLERDKQLIIT